MAPIIEQEVALPYDLPAEPLPDHMGQVRNSGLIIEELPAEPENEERALVLFKPVNTPLIQSPSGFSLDPHLLSRIKNKIWSSKSTVIDSTEDESRTTSDIGNECLAVVPWAPFKIPSASETEVSELMDADDTGVASMDIEEENANVGHGPIHAYNNVPNPGDPLHQWQQQHCLIPELPPNTSEPIVWFR